MLQRPISINEAVPADTDQVIGAVNAALAALADFAVAGSIHVAPQQDNIPLAPHLLAARYAAANSITRRRFDAILREAETVARTGLVLIVGRAGRHDAATAAAARFLGNSIAGSLRRLDNLLVATPA